MVASFASLSQQWRVTYDPEMFSGKCPKAQGVECPTAKSCCYQLPLWRAYQTGVTLSAACCADRRIRHCSILPGKTSKKWLLATTALLDGGARTPFSQGQLPCSELAREPVIQILRSEYVRAPVRFDTHRYSHQHCRVYANWCPSRSLQSKLKTTRANWIVSVTCIGVLPCLPSTPFVSSALPCPRRPACCWGSRKVGAVLVPHLRHVPAEGFQKGTLLPGLPVSCGSVLACTGSWVDFISA